MNLRGDIHSSDPTPKISHALGLHQGNIKKTTMDINSMNGFFSILDFGAVGDGATDCAAAFALVGDAHRFGMLDSVTNVDRFTQFMSASVYVSGKISQAAASSWAMPSSTFVAEWAHCRQTFQVYVSTSSWSQPLSARAAAKAGSRSACAVERRGGLPV